LEVERHELLLGWERPRRSRRRRSSRSLRATFFILLPAVLALLYSMFVATPMYRTEIRFSVRTGDQSAPSSGGSGLSNLLSSASPAAGIMDGYALRDFFESRDGLKAIDDEVGFRKRVANMRIDPVAIAGVDPLYWLRRSSPDEQLYRIYRALVQPRFQMLEQIVVVDVYGLSAEDAKAVADGIFVIAERFSERMNERAREDWAKVSQKQVERSEQRAIETRTAMAKWRKDNNNIDPTANVQLVNTVIGQLEASLASARAELASVIALGDPHHPRRKPIEQRIDAIQAQIKDARDRLTKTNRSEAAQMSEFQRLTAQQDFADKALESDRQSAEAARINLIRQMKYVVPIVRASVPTVPAYPNPVLMVGGALAAGLVLYFLASLIAGAARDVMSR